MSLVDSALKSAQKLVDGMKKRRSSCRSLLRLSAEVARDPVLRGRSRSTKD